MSSPGPSISHLSPTCSLFQPYLITIFWLYSDPKTLGPFLDCYPLPEMLFPPCLPSFRSQITAQEQMTNCFPPQGLQSSICPWSSSPIHHDIQNMVGQGWSLILPCLPRAYFSLWQWIQPHTYFLGKQRTHCGVHLLQSQEKQVCTGQEGSFERASCLCPHFASKDRMF